MVTVRPCQEQDLALLRAYIPTPGQPDRQGVRFGRQQAGDSTFLVAWSDGIPVGAGEILWRGCRAPEVHQHYPDCPELSGLDVWPPERQSQGIGTALVGTAEVLVRQRNRRQIGLGVGDDNPRAAALYLRLGYRETGCHYVDRYHYIDGNGLRHDVADPARFLVKDLIAALVAPANAAPIPINP
jgi:GNAT superfamily N-acetyltransferase